MGKQVSLSSVQVTFGPTAGANVAIEVGNSNAISPTGLASFTKVAKRKHLDGGTQTFQTSSTAKGRYVLIWFTKLPPQQRRPVPGLRLQRRRAGIGLSRARPARAGVA